MVLFSRIQPVGSNYLLNQNINRAYIGRANSRKHSLQFLRWHIGSCTVSIQDTVIIIGSVGRP